MQTRRIFSIWLISCTYLLLTILVSDLRGQVPEPTLDGSVVEYRYHAELLDEQIGVNFDCFSVQLEGLNGQAEDAVGFVENGILEIVTTNELLENLNSAVIQGSDDQIIYAKLLVVIPIDPGNPPPKNRMRLQLQSGTLNAWSKVESHANSPVTVAEINALLDKMFDDYNNGRIPNGPPRNNVTKTAFAAAIAKMKNDIATIPPNGVSNIGNVKRKSFVDSTQTIWRIDLENLAGKNLTR